MAEKILHYWLKATNFGGWHEVSKEDFIKAEYQAGFRSKGGGLATGGFSGDSISGSITYGEPPQQNTEDLAVDVVNMFDQANTGNAIENLGSRGQLLKQAIEDLRVHLNRNGKVTILDSQQANS